MDFKDDMSWLGFLQSQSSRPELCEQQDRYGEVTLWRFGRRGMESPCREEGELGDCRDESQSFQFGVPVLASGGRSGGRAESSRVETRGNACRGITYGKSG